jgi:hypothetical protein
MTDEQKSVIDPLIIMYTNPADNKLTTQLHFPEGWGHEHYGLIVCDLVRHIANYFRVEEDAVWEWVDRERHHHTGDVTWEWIGGEDEKGCRES